MPFYGYSSFDLFYLPSFVGTECNSALTIVYIRAFGYPSDRGFSQPDVLWLCVVADFEDETFDFALKFN